jgi:autotransporter family porin
LTSADNGLNALPIITGTITIIGNSATLTRDSAAPQFRFLEVAAGGILTLNDLTLTNGRVETADSDGGAIYNNGVLTLTTVTLSNNYASDAGGALYNNTGILTATDTTFNANLTLIDPPGGMTTPTGYGGAFYNSTTGTATLTTSTFTSNQSGHGGAIYNHGRLHLSASLFETNNAAQSGGGLYSAQATAQVTITTSQFISNISSESPGGAIVNTVNSTVTITGSELANNQAVLYSTGGKLNSPAGGAIANYATLSLMDSQLTGNSSPKTRGGGIYTTGTITVHHSCISGNSATSVYNATATVQDFSENWWGAASGPGGAGPGSGDSISAAISYQPFITTGCPQ